METSRPSLAAAPPSLGAARDKARRIVELGAQQRSRWEMHFADRLDEIAGQLSVELEAEAADAAAIEELAREQIVQESAAREQALISQYDEAHAQLDEQTAQLAEVSERLAEREADVTEREQRLAELRAELAARDARIAELIEQQSATQDELVAKLESVTEARDALQRKHDRLADESATLRSQAATTTQGLVEHEAVIAELKQRHEAEVQSLTAANLSLSRDHQAQQATDQAAAAESSAALAEREIELTDARAKLATLTDALDKSAQTNDELATQLAEAIRVTTTVGCTTDELAELRQQLEELGERNADLEKSLATANQLQDKAIDDLEALTGERKQLRAQLANLEADLATQAAALADATANTAAADDERVSDLEQRLAMTLDDLRTLRDENSALTEQLAQRATSAVVVADDGLDWESQKRRLLASLAEEADGDADIAPPRQQQRLDISAVIAETDRVVASLNAELARVVAEASERTASEAVPANVVDHLSNEQLTAAVDADEYIQEQRERLAALEAELQNKLGKGELELSMARAKVAREQAELADWRIELELLREQLAGSGGGSSDKPRRRWLDQLGLGKSDE